MPVLRPYTFIDRITEVRCLFRKDGLVTFAALILFETAVLLDDACVVHGDQRVFAFRAIETLLRKTFVFLCKDGCPQKEFVVLRRFNTRMSMLFYRPTVLLQSLNGKLVIGLLVVGKTNVTITVTVIVYMLVNVPPVIVAELIHQRVDHRIILFVTLDKELVDVVINGFTGQQLRYEIIMRSCATSRKEAAEPQSGVSSSGFVGVQSRSRRLSSLLASCCQL